MGSTSGSITSSPKFSCGASFRRIPAVVRVGGAILSVILRNFGRRRAVTPYGPVLAGPQGLGVRKTWLNQTGCSMIIACGRCPRSILMRRGFAGFSFQLRRMRGFQTRTFVECGEFFPTL